MSKKNPRKGTVCFVPFSDDECDSTILDSLINDILENDRDAAQAVQMKNADITSVDVKAIRKLLKAFDASFPAIDRLLAAGPCKEILRHDLMVFGILAGLQLRFEKVAWALQSSAANSLEWHRLGAMIDKLRHIGTAVAKDTYAPVRVLTKAS